MDLKFKIAFFDDARVINAVKVEERKQLSRIGAEIRTRAKFSMRPARRLRRNEITPQIAEEQLGLPPGTDLTNIRGRLNFKLPYKSSEPGEAPRTRKGKQLKRMLKFGYDLSTRSVVVGPERFGPDGAKTLEEGGLSTITIKRRDRQISRSTPAQREGLKKARSVGKLRTRKRPSRIVKVKKQIRIKPRPFIAPPFKAILPSVPKQFQGVIR